MAQAAAENGQKKAMRSFKMQRSSADPIDVPTVVFQQMAANSFTADSPYYNTYVENEMNNLSTLKDVLSDVAEKATVLKLRSDDIVEAMKELAEACRLKPSNLPAIEGEKEIERRQREHLIVSERRGCISDEARLALRNMGKLLDELVGSQISVVDSLNSSLYETVDKLRSSDNLELTTAKNQTDEITIKAEGALDDYLCGKSGDRSSPESPKNGPWRGLWRRSSAAAESDKSKQRAGQPDSMQERSNVTDEEKKANDSSLPINHHPTANSAVSPSRKSGRYSFALKSLDASSSHTRNRQESNFSLKNLSVVGRIKHLQATAELQRFKLFRRVKTTKEQCDFELNEALLESTKQIRCSLVDLADRIQARESKMEDLQRRARKKHDTHSLTWDDRENGIEGIITEIEITDDDTIEEADSFSESGDSTNPSFTDEITAKKEDNLWLLPHELATESRYQRESAPLLLIEGWLYAEESRVEKGAKGGKTGAITRKRRWYMLDRESFSYFEISKWPTETGRFQATLQRVNVCNMGACAIQERKEDSRRFYFQLVSPDNSHVVLQARGPDEYSRWVTAIQQAINGHLGGDPSTSGHMRLRSDIELSYPCTGTHTKLDGDSENSSRLGSIEEIQAGIEELDANQLCTDCGTEQPKNGEMHCRECSRKSNRRRSVQNFVSQSRQLLNNISHSGLIDDQLPNYQSSHSLNHTHELLP